MYAALDKLQKKHNQRIMTFLTRFVLATVLAVFAASSFVHTTGSGAMAANMIATGATITVMPDCDACGDTDIDGVGFACDFVCNASNLTAALVPQMQDAYKGVSEEPTKSATHDFRGLTSPPAKHPPRIFI